MKRFVRIIILTALILAGVLAGYQGIRNSSVSMDSLLGISTAGDGTTVTGWYDGDRTVLARVRQNGSIDGTLQFQTIKKNDMYNIKGIAVGDRYTYVLRNRVNRYTGKLTGQELVVIDFDSLFRKEKKVFELTAEDNYVYGWVNASGDTITLIASDPNGTQAVRSSYEFGSVLDDTLSLKNSRYYPLKSGEGIYKAMGNGTDLVYISDSGKIYCANEQEIWEVYPARTLDTLMYPTFIAYAESGAVYLEEHETGNIIRLTLEDGSEETVLSGNSPFGGSNLYTPRDVSYVHGESEYLFCTGQKWSGQFFSDAGLCGRQWTCDPWIPVRNPVYDPGSAEDMVVIRDRDPDPVRNPESIFQCDPGWTYDHGETAQCNDSAVSHHHGTVWIHFLPVLRKCDPGKF